MSDRRIAQTFRLDTPTPNPFMKSVALTYTLPTTLYTCLNIYDASGRLVEVLVDGEQKPGVHTVLWSGHHHWIGKTRTLDKKVPSGIYFCRLTAGNYSATKKIIMVQ